MYNLITMASASRSIEKHQVHSLYLWLFNDKTGSVVVNFFILMND